jgi:hypothetical protein
MRIIIVLSFCFVCSQVGKNTNTYGWLCTAEDMCEVPWNFIFFELVDKGD